MFKFLVATVLFGACAGVAGEYQKIHLGIIGIYECTYKDFFMDQDAMKKYLGNCERNGRIAETVKTPAGDIPACQTILGNPETSDSAQFVWFGMVPIIGMVQGLSNGILKDYHEHWMLREFSWGE